MNMLRQSYQTSSYRQRQDSRAELHGIRQNQEWNQIIEEALDSDGCWVQAVWFKLTVTVTEMTINWNKSNPLTVTVTVTAKFH